LAAEEQEHPVLPAALTPQNRDATREVAMNLEKLIACLGAESDADLWPEYGEAAQYVRELAEIVWRLKVQWNSTGNALELRHKRDELIQILCSEYPTAAKKLGLLRWEAKSVESKPTVAAGPTSWQGIEIAFLSDERVGICSGGERKTYNYNELGFEDRRKRTANRAWIMLREMAKSGGTIPRPTAGKGRAMVQKRIEEIRRKLRSHFGIEADPIPFNGNTYQASFKIGCEQSFDT